MNTAMMRARERAEVLDTDRELSRLGLAVQSGELSAIEAAFRARDAGAFEAEIAEHFCVTYPGHR